MPRTRLPIAGHSNPSGRAEACRRDGRRAVVVASVDDLDLDLLPGGKRRLDCDVDLVGLTRWNTGRHARKGLRIGGHVRVPTYDCAELQGVRRVDGRGVADS